MPLRTEDVRKTLIGQAREEFAQAAGKNRLLSRLEEKQLNPDLMRSAQFARKRKAKGSKIAVSDATDCYAAFVSAVLKAVDTKGKGSLSRKEIEKVQEPELKSKILDILARQCGGPGPANRALFDARIEDLQAAWDDESGGSRNLRVEATVLFGDTAQTATEDLVAEYGPLHEPVGEMEITGPRSVTDQVLTQLAVSVNAKGFHHVGNAEVPRIKSEIVAVLEAIGGPRGLEYAKAAQLTRVESMGSAMTFAGEMHVIANRETGDAVGFFIRTPSF